MFSAMASFQKLPFFIRQSSRTLVRCRKPLIQPPALRTLVMKHPKDFVPPTEEDLLELRERVQEFTRMYIVLRNSLFGLC